MVSCYPKTVENVVQARENPRLLSCAGGKTARRHAQQGIQGINTYLSRAREETRYVSKCKMVCLLFGSTAFYPLYPLETARAAGGAT